MIRGLFGKLLLVQFVALLLLGIAIVLLFARANLELNWEATQRMHRDLAEHVLHDSPLLPANLSDSEAVADAFHMMMVLGPNLELYVLDTDGRVLNYSAPEESIHQRQVGLEPIRQFLAGGAEFPLLGDDPRSRSSRKPFSVAPILQDGQPMGYLYIIIGSEVQDSISTAVWENALLKFSIGPLVIILLVALMVTLAIFYTIVRPLQRLSRQMERFQLPATGDAGGDEDRSHGSGEQSDQRDEVARLQTTFERLQQRLQEQYQRLLAHKDAQRLLFNQMAHDLRAPMTNAMVAVETADGQLREGPQTQMVSAARESLKMALSSLARLKSHLADMLSLARLDAGQVQLAQELYPLQELVGDCIQEFVCSADSKQVRIDLQAEEQLPPVPVDIGQIARVINNLLDNALRNAPADSVIKAQLGLTGERLRFSISNLVAPLPESAQRTLTADSSGGAGTETAGDTLAGRNRDGGNLESRKAESSVTAVNSIAGGTVEAGLGLAICQRILALHGSSLVLEPGAPGVTFSFDLPLPSPAAKRPR